MTESRRKAVAIIGAGVQGLAAARTLVELDYEVRVFEKLDGIGGTWHERKSYPGLASHGPMKNLFYPDFPGPAGFDENKPFGREDFIAYLESYARHFGLLDLISFGCRVEEIRQDTDRPGNPLLVRALDADGTTIEHVCDYIVYTTFTTVGLVPRFPGDETFPGRIVHTSDLNGGVLETAIRKGERILVLGGNKSAADVVTYLEGRSYKNYLWAFRRNTWGGDYDSVVAGSMTLRLGFYAYYRIFQTPRLRPLAGAAFLPLRLFGYFISPFPESHPLDVGYNGAIWRKEQLAVLRRSHFHRGEIARIDGRDVHLAGRGANRREVRDTFDLIVCGTSFVQTKDARITLSAAGAERPLDQEKSEFLFRNMIHPSAPRIVFWNAAISPGRITLSSYLLSLWFHRHFRSLEEGGCDPAAMMAEIDDDKRMVRENGIPDYNVWKTFQKAQGLFIEKNSRLTLKDLGLYDTKTRLILLSASPADLKEIYLRKLAEMKKPGPRS